MALRIYLLLQVTQKIKKMRLNFFLKKTIGMEMQAINETNTRGQNKEKNFMLGVYEKISTFLAIYFNQTMSNEMLRTRMIQKAKKLLIKKGKD